MFHYYYYYSYYYWATLQYYIHAAYCYRRSSVVCQSVGRSVGLCQSRSWTVQKMAEPIEISFALWNWVVPRNHVLDGALVPQWEGAILRRERRRPIVGTTMQHFDHLLLLQWLSQTTCHVLVTVAFPLDTARGFTAMRVIQRTWV